MSGQCKRNGKAQRLGQALPTAVAICALLLAASVSAEGQLPGKVSIPVAANPRLPVLTNVVAVRDLSPQEASRGYPVRVIGVLTYCDRPAFKHFIQDGSAGIYLDLKTNESAVVLQSGQQVEVLGFSGPGDYAPVIHAKQTQVLGAGQFPPPKPATIRILMTGAEDSQWVSLRGVIRDQSVSTNNETRLVLATGEATIQLTVPRAATTPAPTNLIDAAVEVHGVCSTVFNDRRRLQRVELQVPDWQQIQIKEPATADPFKLPVQAISELFEFHAGNSGLHRARVRGTVILRLADGSFFLQDGTGGIQVQTRAPEFEAGLGQSIEVVGFPATSDKLPQLQEAQVRPAAAPPVVPMPLQAETPPSADWHATLVRLEGRIIGNSVHGPEELLMIQFGQHVVDVTLEKGAGPEQLARLVPGSVVALQGVYLARLDDRRQAQSFQLRLRSAGDVTVLSRPSWWSARHTLWVLGGLGTVLLLVLGWVHLLHKQVQQRTRELQEEIEERKRAELELKRAQGELMRASRLAGMGEVATSVLHNVGNVLNSVNVSACLVLDRLKASKQANLRRAAALLREHEGNLAEFIARDERGRQLPAYLEQLAQYLAQEHATLLQELESLRKNIDHIKDIVAMQQNYARVAGVTETVQLPDLVEDALRMHEGALTRHAVEICRQYDSHLPALTLDKHKVLQILVNLVHNAKYACEESGRQEKRLTIRVFNGGGRLKIAVADNGVGIPPENLTRIFQYGFTTRKDGHGFGLHSGALAAKELGGALLVHSDGPGRGATFTLELPVPQQGVPERSDGRHAPQR